jgi:NADPH-dependent 7-cyano-7-deazaguanine reductase QueF
VSVVVILAFKLQFNEKCVKIVVTTIISHFSLEDTGIPLDFYHLGGNTVKPLIRGREAEGVQLPIGVRAL